MTRLEDRQNLVRDIEQACGAGARMAPACAVAGIDARTAQRWKTGDGLSHGDTVWMPCGLCHHTP